MKELFNKIFNKQIKIIMLILLSLFVLGFGIINYFFYNVIYNENKEYNKVNKLFLDNIDKYKKSLNDKIGTYNIENNYIFKINESFSRIDGNDIIEDSNNILGILILSEDKSNEIKFKLLDKLGYLYKEKEKRGFFLHNVSYSKNFILNILNIKKYNVENNVLLTGVGCSDFSKNDLILEDISIINKEGDLTKKEIKLCEYNFKDFTLLNNIFLLRDSLIKNKDKDNLFLGISNLNGYLNFALFEDEKVIFSTMNLENEGLFNSISYNYSYEYDTKECSEYSITSGFFGPTKKCVKRVKISGDIDIELINDDGVLKRKFYSTNFDELHSFTLKLMGNNILFSDNGSNTNILIPNVIHQKFKNFKDNISLSLKENGNFIKELNVEKILIK